MNVCALATHSWKGEGVESTFTVSADGREVALESSILPAFQVPEGATSIEVTVRPSTPSFFGGTVVLSVDGDGALSVASVDGVLKAIAADVAVAGVRLSTVTVTVSRLRLATIDMTRALRRAPKKRPKKPVVLGDREALLPPPDGPLVLEDRPGVHFIDADAPIADDGVLSFVERTASVDADTFIVELAGVKAPRAISVSWPASVARDEPAPMLVYFRPGAGQNVEDGFYVAPGFERYPWAFDYAFFGMLQYLWYPATPARSPSSKGIPYQVAAAGKDIVTVVACNSVGPEFGVWTDAAAVHEVLLELQAFAAAAADVTAPETLGRLALGAFSSGNAFLSTLLAGGRGHALLTDHVKEVYLFDPPGYISDGLIAGVDAWAKPLGDEALIRYYSREPSSRHAHVAGAPVPRAPYIEDSADGTRTVGAVSPAQWQAALTKLKGAPLGVTLDWQAAHQLISAFLLTHAIARSGF